jgi:hypothetical protein
MPSPKSGKACSLTDPTAPKEVHDADVADPGEVSKAQAEAAQTNKGKYAPQEVKPAGEVEPEELDWIEIELVDQEDKPVPCERFELKKGEEVVTSGTLDSDGFVRVEGIKKGSYDLCFPRLHKDGWEKA